MATSNAKKKPETPEGSAAAVETPENAATTTGRDHVAQVSRRADGTPDQTPDFVVIVDEDGRAPIESTDED